MLIFVILIVMFAVAICIRNYLVKYIPYKIRLFARYIFLMTIYGIIAFPITIIINPPFPNGRTPLDNIGDKPAWSIFIENYFIPILGFIILGVIVFILETLIHNLTGVVMLKFSQISRTRELCNQRGLFGIDSNQWKLKGEEFLENKKTMS